MTYKITIEEVIPPKDGEKYGSSSDKYFQVVENLDLQGVVNFINRPKNQIV